MSVPASLHDLFFSCVSNSDCFGFIFVLLSWIALYMHVFNWVCVCLCVCVTVGAAPSRESTRLGAVCRRTLWRRASHHSSPYPIPTPRAHPIHNLTHRHYLISPSFCRDPRHITRSTPDGWPQYTVGLWGQWGWGGHVTGHGHICCRTGRDSHGSGETGECAGPHRAFYCECWEMEEQREGRAGRAGIPKDLSPPKQSQS